MTHMNFVDVVVVRVTGREALRLSFPLEPTDYKTDTDSVLIEITSYNEVNLINTVLTIP